MTYKAAPEFDALVGRVPEEIWQRLRGTRWFVTGGTGWFGRNLLETVVRANTLIGTGIAVTILSRNPARFAAEVPHLASAPGIELQSGDITDFPFPAGDFSHVLHAAATSARETSTGEPPLAKFDMLVDGTRRVLEFVRRCGATHLLFTSSGVATAPPVGGIYREDEIAAPSSLDPATALGQGKRAAEFLCASHGAAYGINTTIARCFSFVGPFMPLDLHYAIGNFIREALNGEPIIVKGDGSPLRSYLYTGDLVIWLLTLLARKGSPRIYNVGSDRGISIGDLAERVCDALAPGLNVRILGKTTLSVGNPTRDHYVPDITRAREELQLDVWTPLEQAIRDTASHALRSTGLPILHGATKHDL